ncbi:MAG: glycosyltransferase family 39 protein [Chloroflexota bacterium]|nr:glycosyltransferase family 39 protein [Chloroflexota bacterium]
MSRLRGFVRRHPDAVAVLVVVGLALAFKLGFALRVAPFISKDSQAYFFPAWTLVHDGAFQLGLRRTPGYSGFLAGALLLVGDDLRGIILLQHLLGVGTAVLTYVLGRLAFGRLVGLGAGALAAISAPLVAYEHYLLSESLFAFAVTAALAALAWAWRRESGRLWLLGGLCVGLSTLVKPIGQIVLPLAILAPIVAARPWRFGLGLASTTTLRAFAVAPALVLLGYGLAVVPWTVRNKLVHDLAAPSTFGRTLIARTASYDRGFVFYDPDNPPSDPVRGRALEIIQRGAKRSESDGTIATRLREELDLDPIEVNALMRDAALDVIARQPAYFVQGTLRFGLHIFNGEEISLRDHEAERKDVVWNERTRDLLVATRSDDDARAASQLLRWYQPAEYAPLPLVLFALGLVSAAARPAWRPALLPALAVVALILASAALNGPQERYRYPADPALTVIALGGIAGLVGLVRSLASLVSGGWATGRPKAGAPGSPAAGAPVPTLEAPLRPDPSTAASPAGLSRAAQP